MMWNLNLDFPALVLIGIFLIVFWVLWRAHKAENGLNFAEMLQDDGGKASAGRLSAFVALAISSWGFMYILITRKGEIDTWLFLGYVGIWSGAKVVERGVDAYLVSKSGGAIAPPRPMPRPTPPPAPVDPDDEDTGAPVATSKARPSRS